MKFGIGLAPFDRWTSPEQPRSGVVADLTGQPGSSPELPEAVRDLRQAGVNIKVGILDVP